ncbi:MAG: MmgE/PrpD family protein, partial [Alphaproteobacteria bacterium]|nr:MmgE/PrpD family protein [Alphaproteobacteria bacterium]
RNHGRDPYCQRGGGAVCAFDPETLSEPVIEQAKLLVLDSLGCAIAAHGVETVEQVHRMAAALGGAPQATLIGGDSKSSVLNAILVNGAMVRVLDLNDYAIVKGKDGQPAMGGHPSDNVAGSNAATASASAVAVPEIAVTVGVSAMIPYPWARDGPFLTPAPIGR